MILHSSTADYDGPIRALHGRVDTLGSVQPGSRRVRRRGYCVSGGRRELGIGATTSSIAKVPSTSCNATVVR